MSRPIFPGSQPSTTSLAFGLPGLGYEVQWSPIFFNQSQKAANGASIDIDLANGVPLHNFELTYPFLRDYPSPHTTEFGILMSFFLQLGGSKGRFDFLNVDDNTMTNQQIAVSDGTTASYVINRLFSSGFYQQSEPVGDVVGAGGTGTPQVFYNGVLKTAGTDYTIDTSVGARCLLNLINIPAATVVISMTCSYYYYCKFADDTMTFKKFVNLVWSNQSVKIQSCRPGA